MYPYVYIVYETEPYEYHRVMGVYTTQAFAQSKVMQLRRLQQKLKNRRQDEYGYPYEGICEKSDFGIKAHALLCHDEDLEG